MRIAICEDEMQTALALQAMMKASGREITLYPDAQMLLADWERGIRFDVVFTDIVMGDEAAGMDLCGRLSAEGAVFLIVVTNYIEYAPEGYRKGVFRYLMKPVRQETLDQVFAEIENKNNVEKGVTGTSITGMSIPGKNGSEKMMVGAFDGNHVIAGEDILYVEVHGRYLEIYLRDGQGTESVVTLMQSLKEFAAHLPRDRFARVNRNQLVNLDRITLVKQGQLVLESGGTLSVSRRQQRELQEALARYLA
ncbi:MAG: LytTR family DNA-binding domain-containing protein [Muribaculum sp.]|nr:LytTR family DNA-binding domain-containing protein [Muribaculum sp.]